MRMCKMVGMRSFGKDDDKFFTERSKFKRKCKCGHTIPMSPNVKKLLCNWCGRYVFRDDKDEFLYRLNEAKNKEVEK